MSTIASDNTTTPTIEAYGWICSCCMIMLANADDCQDDSTSHPMGLLANLADDDDVTPAWDSNTGEGMQDFSDYPCTGCTTPLAGARYLIAFWA